MINEDSLVPQPTQPDAAVLDLGSNSFHLLLAHWGDAGWRPLAHRAEKVQLATGLARDADINTAALERACACLAQFAPQLRQLPSGRVVIVGTEALRMARNRAAFIERAERLLGHPVTVLSGAEEARLIFIATAAEQPAAARRLVIDVGGASTELAAGLGDEVAQAASVPVGCLTWRRFFAGGALSEANFQRAYAAACELFAVEREICAAGTLVVGCSGTLQALEQVLLGHGWSDGGINRAALATLQRALLRFDHIDAVAFDGLSESRRTIFAAGAAVVMALFDTLEIEQMSLSPHSLRHGVMERLWQQHQQRQRTWQVA